jgi:hypothetical protein
VSISDETKYGLTCDMRQPEVGFAKQKRCLCCRAVRTPDPKKVRVARRGNRAFRRTKWGSVGAPFGRQCRCEAGRYEASRYEASRCEAGRREQRRSGLRPETRQKAAPPWQGPGPQPALPDATPAPTFAGMTQTAARWPTSRSQRASEAEDSVACHGFRRSECTRDRGSCLAANDPELC